MEKVTPCSLKEYKLAHRKITMLSIYDYAVARLAENAGLDTILVGDSLAFSVLGYNRTTAVTLEEMLHHTRAVTRAAKRMMVIADMPFMSYQISCEEAVRNAGRFIGEAGADAVKVEGGRAMIDTVRAIRNAGIPVLGHIGLTLQSAGEHGGEGVRGDDAEAAMRLMEDARALEAAGVFALILQCVPAELARLITQRLGVPVISYGAGPHCDGQGLVSADVFGLGEDEPAKFAKCFAPVGETIRQAIADFCGEVRSGQFPDAAHSYSMDGTEFAKLSAGDLALGL